MDGDGGGETFLRQAYDAIFHGDFESAIHWFGKAIEQEPDNASFYYKASITCARSGKMSMAETYAKRAAELDPEDPYYALNLQSIVAKRLIAEARELLAAPVPDAAGAKTLLTEAETLDPLAVEAKLLLGWSCRLERDYRSAIAYLKETLLLDPELDEAKRLLQETRAARRRHLRSQITRPTPKRNR